MKTNELHKELKFRMSRSSGSGGQHVNKVSTRVELLFDVVHSIELNEDEKALILDRWSNRITQEGILLLASDASRSQMLNKSAVIKKFDQLIAQALAPVKERPETGAYTADKRKRLNTKKRIGEKKSNRKKVIFRRDDDLSSFSA
ncbi:MAG: alternative ribosome rescue aminoacyl-tRNA hydrolase ArfB [Saprospiraceae bacterium]|nr:alternative ribosome rescue aminoacyl-tRNA hydrolase ArfB [Saprospiraceae bacterium]